MRYENVTFRFPAAAGRVRLDFEAKPGQTIAWSGHTGSGKTTTLALLQRLRDPHAGRITVDGVDIRDVKLASLRGLSAVVFQDAGLFNRSIGENIRIGKPTATDAEVEQRRQACRGARFHLRKPEGFDFIIGERGASLSGGERQRLAIARDRS